ncbi:MAG: peptidyl-prolyl cis-trans isomerase [Candidatus Brocadiia bacterium]
MARVWMLAWPLLVVVGGVAADSEGELINAVVAVVNDEPVTKMEVDRLVAEIRRKAAETDPETLGDIWEKARQMLIDQRLLVQEAKRQGIEVDPEDVNAEIQRWKDRGVDVEGYRDMVRETLLVERLLMRLQSVRSVTPEQVAAYYRKHSEEFALPERRRVSLIAIYPREMKSPDGGPATRSDARRLAGEILERLKKGEDFAALARQASHGPAARKGGDQGWLEKGSWVEPLEQAVASLEPGEVSGLVPMADGFLILKLTGVQEGGALSLAEARPQILRRLQRQQRQRLERQLLERLRREATIVRIDAQSPAGGKP